jgi:hypothetical protein
MAAPEVALVDPEQPNLTTLTIDAPAAAHTKELLARPEMTSPYNYTGRNHHHMKASWQPEVVAGLLVACLQMAGCPVEVV